MDTINAIAPLLNPGITDKEAQELVAGLTDDQKSIAVLALTKAFRDSVSRVRDMDSLDAVSRILGDIVGDYRIGT